MKGSVKCAALLGGALALSGFLLQTFFANPIAGPFVMGVSSGAKLMVALARALCQEPEILVLDDPISYLDVHHRTELLFILRRMARNQGLAVILPLHEIDLAEKVADRVLCVKGETIACSGTPEEVFAAGNIEALFDLRPGRPCSFWSGHAIRTGCRRGSCAAGREALRLRRYPEVSRMFASPMRRCIETAAILYPGMTPELVPDFRECDFGAFEGKNYAELNGRADYQAWIGSGGELPFPGGESRAAFAWRCARAFERLCMQSLQGDCALIVHGGTIMAIMERVALPRGRYFDYQVKPGEGFLLNPGGTYQKLVSAYRAESNTMQQASKSLLL